MPKQEVSVTQNPDAPVPAEVMAQSIVRISDGIAKLLHSGLNKRAVIALVKDSTRIEKATIERVIDGLESLAFNYTTNGKKRR